MAVRTQITQQGASLLATSSTASGQNYWIGWYALAYVPPEIKDEDDEKPSATMTKLTTRGDMIYNIFQGDVNGEGYVTQSANSNFGIVNYDSNIKKNYRYVIDSTGRNNLVTWISSDTGLKGAYVYKGVDVSVSDSDNSVTVTESAIPLPAPLFYTGEDSAAAGFNTTGMQDYLKTGTQSAVSKFYPTLKTNVSSVSNVEVPRVSTDYRKYNVYRSGIQTPGAYKGDYSDGLPCQKILDNAEMDGDGWFSSELTYTHGDDTTISKEDNAYCKEYWKALSISNFNKYCAPVNSVGLAYDEDAGCRNMAKTTKYFPIYSYNVINTKEYDTNEYATGIKLGIKLNITTSVNTDETYSDASMSVDGSGNVEYVNKSFTSVKDTAGNQIFSSNSVSFKFNRMGIYAVPMRQYGCSGDNVKQAQYQIDTEKEPVLFAICDWDSPTTLSDTGDGLTTFETDVCIDLSLAVEDSAVIRDSALFYNLYEDDSIDWYKNQLLANASMSEAITNMQVEIGYLKNKKSSGSECCNNSIDLSQYAKKTDNHSTFKNLVDTSTYSETGVRSIGAAAEGIVNLEIPGKAVLNEAYNIGHGSFSLGEGSSAGGIDSFNMAANSGIDSQSSYVSIMNGYDSIVKSSHSVALLNSVRNYVYNSGYVTVDGTDNDVEECIEKNVHIHGNNNIIKSIIDGNNLLVNGDNNTMETPESVSSFILNGNTSNVEKSTILYSIFNGSSNNVGNDVIISNTILNGPDNTLMSTSSKSILSNSIINGSYSTFEGNYNIIRSFVIGCWSHIGGTSSIQDSSIIGSYNTINDLTATNAHIIGFINSINGITDELNNVIIFAAARNTTIGAQKTSAIDYSQSYTNWCLANFKNYPTIFTEGGIGLYGRRITLGNLDTTANTPTVGDSLVVESVDGNTAVVNWKQSTITSSLSMSIFNGYPYLNTRLDTPYAPHRPGSTIRKLYRYAHEFDTLDGSLTTYFSNIDGTVIAYTDSTYETLQTMLFTQLECVLYIQVDSYGSEYNGNVVAETRFILSTNAHESYSELFSDTIKTMVTEEQSKKYSGLPVSAYIELQINSSTSTNYVLLYDIGTSEDSTSGSKGVLDTGITIFKQIQTDSSTTDAT